MALAQTATRQKTGNSRLSGLVIAFSQSRLCSVEVSRLDGVHKVTHCRQVFFQVHPEDRVVIADRKSQKPLLCGASPFVISLGVCDVNQAVVFGVHD